MASKPRLTDKEAAHHYIGCVLIVEAAAELSLCQDVVLCAQMLYHRFFYRLSLKTYDNLSIAMACMLLAAKLENKVQVVRDVVLAFHRLYLRHRNMPAADMELGCELYSLWKDELIGLEIEVMKELGFACYLDMDRPHFHALGVLDAWKVGKSVEALNSTDFPNLTQSYLNTLNDLMFFDIVVRFDAQYLAIAAWHYVLVDKGIDEAGAFLDVVSRTCSLDPLLLQEILSELRHSKTIPFVEIGAPLDATVTVEEVNQRRVICWLEPLAEVPFLQMTERLALQSK